VPGIGVQILVARRVALDPVSSIAVAVLCSAVRVGEPGLLEAVGLAPDVGCTFELCGYFFRFFGFLN